MPDSNYIHGIGDEVIIALVAGLLISIPAGIYTYRRVNWPGIRNFFGGEWRTYFRRRRPRIPENETVSALGNRLQNVEPGTYPPPPRTYNSDQCSICLHVHRLALETNCGHIYCGNCLRTCIFMNGFMERIDCPICRQLVSILFILFSETELQAPLASLIGSEARQLYEMVYEYNRRFSGEPRSILEMVRDWPTLMRHLWNEFFSVGGLVLMFRIRVVLCFTAALMYLFLPIDVIPESVFGVLGLLDDMFVFFLLAIYVSIIYRRVIVNRRLDT
ncbi:E3 ubiquitin-protein ligase RNF170-like [Periplaneta americana]|uniref:E3 ubiquitin-protein ligase RNF170-like n=1 Tax=Periplaneta americana TaxID=6978 RepID=UPI0037E9C60D